MKQTINILLIVLLVSTICCCLTIVVFFKFVPNFQQFPPDYGPMETAIQESKPTNTQLPPTQVQEILPNPTESPAEELTPTPVFRSRVVFVNASNNVEFTTLVSAAAAEGIEITMVSTRNDFLDEMAKPDVALVILPADSGANKEDLQATGSFVGSGGNMLFLYDHRWQPLSNTFQDLFNVSILREEVINVGGEYSLQDTLPSFLGNLDVFTKGTAWILGGAYLETDLQGGEESYIESMSSGKNRLVFFSTPDKSVTFLLTVRASNLGSSKSSSIFFDDLAIENGDNQKAALLLISYLIEGCQN